MALEIECARCKQALTLDEGFAGGVCRCLYCGGLMKVPRPAGLDTGSQNDERPATPPPLSQLKMDVRSRPTHLAAGVVEADGSSDSTDAQPGGGGHERVLIALVVMLAMLLAAAVGVVAVLVWG